MLTYSRPDAGDHSGFPWIDRRRARAFLEGVADTASGRSCSISILRSTDAEASSEWLRRHGLAAAAYPFARRAHPELAERLRPDALSAAAANLARFRALDAIEAALAEADIPMVVLKGGALASSAYADPSLRPMTDLDLWVRDDDVPRASRRLERLGYRQVAGVPDRPPELQRRSGGEIVFESGETQGGLVELHYCAFQGWWIRRAARADAEGVWRRAVPLGSARHARRLAAEDAVLQVSFHVVVNQFGQVPLRGLLDLAVIARAHEVSWSAVTARARAWRLSAAVGLVLATADALFGLPGASAALEALAPHGARRALLRRFVTPESVLAGRDLTRTALRHPFLLALVDRPADGARLVGRTLWPEAWWREARYGRPVGPAGHLWSLMRRGAV